MDATRRDVRRRDRSLMRRSTSELRHRALLAFFLAALAMLVFAGGVHVGRTEAFPFEIVQSAYRTVLGLHEAYKFPSPYRHDASPVDLLPEQVSTRRIAFHDRNRLADRIIFPGGFGRFMELCPGHPGCIAVEYADQGQPVRVYPYRPHELEQAMIVDLPFEIPLAQDIWKRTYVFGLDTYPNGDLLVVFHHHVAYPMGAGIARIGIDGRPVWYRRDYSHHEAHIASDEIAWVSSARIDDGLLRVDYDAPRQQLGFELRCNRPYVDTIQAIGPDGERLVEISLFETLAASPFRFLLRHSPFPCDPIHANSVHVLGPDASGPYGIRPGDLVVSMRHLNAFVVLDQDDYDVKTLVRGTFHAQHSVKHFGGSRFLVFDNHGVQAGQGGPSRVLLIDLADGSEETIVPRPSMPDVLQQQYSDIQGSVSISPDRQRLIVNYHISSKAFEIEIATGKVLTEFTSVHDMTSLEGGASVIRYKISPGIRYVLDP